MDRLVLFTLQFPFGNVEQFLETEIEYLAKNFQEVYLIPSSHKGVKRKLPANVIVSDIVIPENQNIFKILIQNFFSAIRIFTFCLLSGRDGRSHLRSYRSMAGHFCAEFVKIKCLKSFIVKNQLTKAIFYDYWFVNSTLVLAELKRKKIIRKIISRAHGFDLYDERQFEGTIPFRRYRAHYMDKILAISQHGSDYLKRKLPEYSDKIHTSYLGVHEQVLCPVKQGTEYVIVSCSSIIPLKRVDLIANAIKKMSLPVRWIHFGDGPDFEKIEQLKNTMPAWINVELKGQLLNTEILEFYRQNYVDLFITLSESEGIPVSVMEAMSFGIPAMACDINGLPELVTAQTGWLVPVDETVNKISETVHELLTTRQFDREEIKRHILNNFNASKNYTTFVQMLKNDVK